MNEKQIKQIGVGVLIWPELVLWDLGVTSRRMDGWIEGWMDGWRGGGPTVHCRWFSVCEGGGVGRGLRWTSSSWLAPPTLILAAGYHHPQWRANTANREISCDLSFSHVSFCWCLTVWFSLLLIGSSQGLNYWPGLLCCSCFLTANTEISHLWNVQGEEALLYFFARPQWSSIHKWQIQNNQIEISFCRPLFAAWVLYSC